MKQILVAALLGGASLAAVHGQSFSGIVPGGADTYGGAGGTVGGVSNGTGFDVKMGGSVTEAVTLNPGTLTFTSLDYTATSPSSASASIWTPIHRTDPNTFQTVTYNIFLTLDPYTYTSSSTQPLALTPQSDGTLSFNSNGAFTKPPVQLTGTVVVDGPNQDLNIPFNVSVPTHSGYGFSGSIDVANYPASINLKPASTDFAQWSGNLVLASGTIDGLPFSYSLTALYNSFSTGGQTTLTVVPEPSSYALAAGVSLLGFLGIRHYQRRKAAAVSSR